MPTLSLAKLCLICIISHDNLLHKRMTHDVTCGKLGKTNLIYIFKHLECSLKARGLLLIKVLA